jgi:hypothetical protein
VAHRRSVQPFLPNLLYIYILKIPPKAFTMTFADSRKHSSSQLQNSTLSQLQGNVVVPSTLSMKERTNLRRNDPYEYGRWVTSTTAASRQSHMCTACSELLACKSAKEHCSADKPTPFLQDLQYIKPSWHVSV